jgi:hypothetical protein
MDSIIKHTAILTVEEYKAYNAEWRDYVKSLSIGDTLLSIYQTSYEIKFPKFEDWLLKKLRDLDNGIINEIHVIHSTEVSTKHL